MHVRAKFTLDTISRNQHGSALFTFVAVGDDGIPENQRFHRYTPSGKLEMVVTNPAVIESFQLGQSYYLDFTPVPPPAS